ncbi:MAG TPA: alpha/beta fold hydrolase, partial [Sorangium sp.]|nr:alpha/beta fold hydrolase [Sorangium sp.]
NRSASRLIDGCQQLALALDGTAADNHGAPSETVRCAPSQAAVTPLRSDAMGTGAWLRDSALALLNGAFGDHLERQHSALATPMTVRHQGKALSLNGSALAAALPHASGRLCLFIHGLACTEWTFSYDAERLYADPCVNYGTLLARDLGMTPLYLRYNSGRHISHNGQQLARVLQQLVDHYPVPIDELVLIGHSMGGLLARSACYYGPHDGWVKKLRRVICLGSPHLGAPLEQASHMLSLVLRSIDTMGTQIPGHILNARSSGIKDLRFGYILDEDWLGASAEACDDRSRRDVPFVEHADYYFVAGTISEDPSSTMATLLGDVLVRPKSAAGVHQRPLRSIPFAAERGATAAGLSHLRLANHPLVYQHMVRWCRAP